MNRQFAVFILTYNRPDNVVTYRKLREYGYTGKIFLLCDDTDRTIDRYKELYGTDSVIVFPKREAQAITDAGDNFTRSDSVVYARNWNFQVARELGLTHFLQLDDDYYRFQFTIDKNRRHGYRKSRQLDRVFDLMLDFIDATPFDAIAMAQGGDFSGGEKNTLLERHRNGDLTRKVMNSFFFRVDRQVEFFGRMNDDVNTYVCGGRQGRLYMTVPFIRVSQNETQSSAGGLTEMYRAFGTYVKSFYTILYAPSCVKISVMGKAQRVHHQVLWRYAVPKIISESFRKLSA